MKEAKFKQDVFQHIELLKIHLIDNSLPVTMSPEFSTLISVGLQ